MKPKFSIITANYNNGKFLGDCINSVLSQTFSAWEWIIVDDFSDDDSAKILHKINDPRIKVIFNSQREYCSSSYKVALENTSSIFCGVLDADDAISRNAVYRILYLYRKYPKIKYIYTQHYWCNENLKPFRTGISSSPKRNFASDAHKNQKHCFSHWRTFNKTIADTESIFPPGLRFAVDKNMGFVLEESGEGAFLPEPLYYYRYYKGNMSKVFPKEQKETWLSLAKQFSSNNKKKNQIYNIHQLEINDITQKKSK